MVCNRNTLQWSLDIWSRSNLGISTFILSAYSIALCGKLHIMALFLDALLLFNSVNLVATVFAAFNSATAVFN